MPGTRRLLLIADGDLKLLDRAAELARKAGFDVLPLTSGREVVTLAALHRPQLIVLDVKLPDADGRDLLQAIKNDPRIRDIPVLIWSARDYDSDRLIALELGAVDYLPKADPHGLLTSIERALIKAKRDAEQDSNDEE